jgi:hypothetical protein
MPLPARPGISGLLIFAFCLPFSAEGTAAQESASSLPMASIRPFDGNCSAAGAVPAGTFVSIAIQDHLNSKLNHVGDTFSIALTDPIMCENKVVVPAGTEGRGEIIHVARARAAGKAGELIVAARTLEWSGRTIRLRSLRFGKAGDSRVAQGAVLAVVGGPLAYLVVGGEVDVPPGTAAHAKLAEAIHIEAPSARAADGKEEGERP